MRSRMVARRAPRVWDSGKTPPLAVPDLDARTVTVGSDADLDIEALGVSSQAWAAGEPPAEQDRESRCRPATVRCVLQWVGTVTDVMDTTLQWPPTIRSCSTAAY